MNAINGRRSPWRYGFGVDRRALASWLTGGPPKQEGTSEAGYRGSRLHLPEAGPGSVASFSRRLAAIALDWWMSLLIARGLLGLGAWWVAAVLAVEYIVLLPTLGMTVGMRLARIRVVSIVSSGLPRWPAAVVRTALLLLVIPAVVYDKDGRGLHDRAAGTAVVRI